MLLLDLFLFSLFALLYATILTLLRARHWTERGLGGLLAVLLAGYPLNAAGWRAAAFASWEFQALVLLCAGPLLLALYRGLAAAIRAVGGPLS